METDRSMESSDLAESLKGSRDKLVLLPEA